MCFEKVKSGIFFILVVFIILQDSNAKLPLKIKGGETASIEDYSSMVSIRIYGRHSCGGSLISNRHVLTAAHCVVIQQNKVGPYQSIRPTNAYLIVAGTNISYRMGDFYEVSQVHVHERYTGDMKDGLEHDIAILTLDKPLNPAGNYKPIALPFKDTYPNTIACVVGWGSSDEFQPASAYLKKAETRIYRNDACEAWVGDRIYDSQLCGIQSRGTGFCDGDSGGPLIANNKIIGIVSSSIGCGMGYPDLYTRVYTYLNWIEQKMRE